MKTIKILRVLGRLWPVAREFILAVDRASEGGKRITPTERDRILATAAGQGRTILDDYIGPQ